MATITNLQGSTQIWNSDEIINQNFQNINNAMVEKTGDQSIAGIKTFTDRNIIQDVTNNTENPYMRVTAHSRKTKNLNNAGWVDFALYTDADGSLIWNRKLSFRGYLKKRLDWAIATYNELFLIEYDTYDGDTTYTTKARFNTTSFRFWEQNRTSNRTSFTPTVTGNSWTVGTNWMAWYYKVIWKTCFCRIYGSLQKWTLTGRIYFSLPITSATNNEDIVPSIFWPVNTTPATSYWFATIWGNSWLALEVLKQVGVAWSWADHWSGTIYFNSNFTYQTI